MEHERFDRLTRTLAHGLTRRGALAAFAMVSGAGLATSDHTRAKKKKKKQVTLCRNGQTIQVTKKKKQKHLQPGDITGPCSPPAPPGPPVGPPPGPPPSPPPGPPPPPPPLDCPPPVPNFCAKLDTCEPRCSAGKVFDADSCVCVCDQPTTCCFCFREGQAIFFQSIPDEEACEAACTAAGGEDVTFEGGDGSSAQFDLLNDVCNVTCEADPMTCPAGFRFPTCDAGTSCCSDGCCSIDAPVCCPPGSCCPAALPVCCAPTHCCPEGSACCQGDGECGVGRVCQIDEGFPRGCCVAALERSPAGRTAPMVLATSMTPKRDASVKSRKRSRRQRR